MGRQASRWFYCADQSRAPRRERVRLREPVASISRVAPASRSLCPYAARQWGGIAKAYADALASNGLEETGSISTTRRGEQGDEYFVRHNGNKRELDRHLKKGNSREGRRCFR